MCKIKTFEYEVSGFAWGRINFFLKLDTDKPFVNIKATSTGRLDFSDLKEDANINIIENNYINREVKININPSMVEKFSYTLTKKAKVQTWKPQYEDPFTTDGESWEVVVRYDNDYILRSCGLCKFPPEYRELLSVVKPMIKIAGIIL